MRFAILGSRGFPSTYGGFETFVRHLAPALRDDGHDVTVYCRFREEDSRVWMRDGVRCVYTPGFETKSLSTLSFGATAMADAAARTFDAMLVLNIAHGYFLPLTRARRIPVALNVDGLEWHRGKWSALGRSVFKGGAWTSAHWANRLVVDSRAIGDWWEHRFGVKTDFIPYGGSVIEDSADDRVRDEGLEPGTYALVVARLIPENNVELTLDALRLVDPGIPTVVVGTAGYPSPLERRLEDADGRNELRWLRHVSDQGLLGQLWRHCAVYIHGHSVGGTNPALLQALGAGAPTLALDTVYNREVLASDEQLYPPVPEVLAERLRELQADPARRERLAARGRDIIRERYEWDDVCAQYADLLVEMATGVSRAAELTTA